MILEEDKKNRVTLSNYSILKELKLKEVNNDAHVYFFAQIMKQMDKLEL